MRILLVKTSSLGDVVHNLPVAADLARHFPGISIDWCVEESFVGIPQLSPHVSKVIPVAIRRWRKRLLAAETWSEIGEMRRRLKECVYDAVLDTQGLLKSALLTRLAAAPRLGYAADAAREPIAARCYDRCFSVARNRHAVERNRLLAAAAFGYLADTPLDYGIKTPDRHFSWLPEKPIATLLTATSRDDKLWPEADWIALGQQLATRGLRCVLPSGSPTERERASRIAAAIPGAMPAPPLGIADLASLLGQSSVVIGVDTGLVHLAAALRTPTIALYTATDPALTGVVGSGFTRNLGGRDRSPRVSDVLSIAEEALS